MNRDHEEAQSIRNEGQTIVRNQVKSKGGRMKRYRMYGGSGPVEVFVISAQDQAEVGSPARRVFLDTRFATIGKTKYVTLVDTCEDREQMATFERWAEMSHEDHLDTIAMIEKEPSRFLEISPCPDGYDPVRWLKEKAVEQGVRVSV